MGVFQGLCWNGFSGFSLALIDAGRAAVLAFTMPVWATLLAAVFLGERVTLRRLLGLCLGMAAIALLLLPALGALDQATFGVVLMLAAALSWAIATVIVRGVTWSISPLVLSGWQFLIGAVQLGIAAVVLGKPSTLLDVDWRTAAALAYSSLIALIFCQAVFFALVRRVPASLAAMGTLLVPPLGVFFSAAILDETIGLPEIGALLLVVLAMVFVLPGFSLQAIRRRRAVLPPG